MGDRQEELLSYLARCCGGGQVSLTGFREGRGDQLSLQTLEVTLPSSSSSSSSPSSPSSSSSPSSFQQQTSSGSGDGGLFPALLGLLGGVASVLRPSSIDGGAEACPFLRYKRVLVHELVLRSASFSATLTAAQYYDVGRAWPLPTLSLPPAWGPLIDAHLSTAPSSHSAPFLLLCDTLSLTSSPSETPSPLLLDLLSGPSLLGHRSSSSLSSSSWAFTVHIPDLELTLSPALSSLPLFNADNISISDLHFVYRTSQGQLEATSPTAGVTTSCGLPSAPSSDAVSPFAALLSLAIPSRVSLLSLDLSIQLTTDPPHDDASLSSEPSLCDPRLFLHFTSLHTAALSIRSPPGASVSVTAKFNENPETSFVLASVRNSHLQDSLEDPLAAASSSSSSSSPPSPSSRFQEIVSFRPSSPSLVVPSLFSPEKRVVDGRNFSPPRLNSPAELAELRDQALLTTFCSVDVDVQSPCLVSGSPMLLLEVAWSLLLAVVRCQQRLCPVLCPSALPISLTGTLHHPAFYFALRCPQTTLPLINSTIDQTIDSPTLIVSQVDASLVYVTDQHHYALLTAQDISLRLQEGVQLRTQRPSTSSDPFALALAMQQLSSEPPICLAFLQHVHLTMTSGAMPAAVGLLADLCLRILPAASHPRDRFLTLSHCELSYASSLFSAGLRGSLAECNVLLDSSGALNVFFKELKAELCESVRAPELFSILAIPYWSLLHCSRTSLLSICSDSAVSVAGCVDGLHILLLLVADLVLAFQSQLQLQQPPARLEGLTLDPQAPGQLLGALAENIYQSTPGPAASEYVICQVPADFSQSLFPGAFAIAEPSAAGWFEQEEEIFLQAIDAEPSPLHPSLPRPLRPSSPPHVCSASSSSGSPAFGFLESSNEDSTMFAAPSPIPINRSPMPFASSAQASTAALPFSGISPDALPLQRVVVDEELISFRIIRQPVAIVEEYAPELPPVGYLGTGVVASPAIRGRFPLRVRLFRGADVIDRRTEDFVELELNAFHFEVNRFSEDGPRATAPDWTLRMTVGQLVVHDGFQGSDLTSVLRRDRSAAVSSGIPDLVLTLECFQAPQAASAEYAVTVKLAPIKCQLDQSVFEFLADVMSFSDTSSQATDGALYFRYVHVFPVSLNLHFKPSSISLPSTSKPSLPMVEVTDLSILIPKLRLRGVDGFWGLSQLLKAHVTKAVVGEHPSFVAGLASQLSHWRAIKPFVNIGGGIADLVRLPIYEYHRKEGNLLWGFKRGVESFASVVTQETLGIGAKLSSGAKNALQFADSSLSQPSEQSAPSVGKPRSRPKGVTDGLQQGFESLRREYSRTSMLIAVPRQVYDDQGLLSAAGSTARVIPLAVIRPLIGVTEGLTRTLLGVQSGYNPNLVTDKEHSSKPDP
ncbi:MAG: hypothetical protein Q8P67_16465 [archaeon]|nr:hypothetical protein [archaeon]